MKMSEVRPGMRLKSVNPGDTRGVIIVTGMTERGFNYTFESNQFLSIHPRSGLSLSQSGHEHLGYKGESFYEPVDQLQIAPQQPHRKKSCCWVGVILGIVVISLLFLLITNVLPPSVSR